MSIDSNRLHASDSAGTYGPCGDCGRIHSLPVGNARQHALALMRDFERFQRLDFAVPAHLADPRLSFSNLFPPGRGNMFGVLECETPRGDTVILRAFSSLWEGIREVDSWVLPLLSAKVFSEVIVPAQEEIKRLTAQLRIMDTASALFVEVKKQRKRVSQTLWDDMREAYRFRNFRGETRPLIAACWPSVPMPGGVGECCAPKLLNHAAKMGWRPKGLAEFYWGAPDRKRQRVQGAFYGSCETRCRPILGFMLCGADGEARRTHRAHRASEPS